MPDANLGALLKLAGREVNALIVDVEGAEQFIDWDEMPREINKIIIELHPRLMGAEKTYDLVSNLIVRGFSVAREEEGTFVFLRRNRDPIPVHECSGLARAGLGPVQNGNGNHAALSLPRRTEEVHHGFHAEPTPT